MPLWGSVAVTSQPHVTQPGMELTPGTSASGSWRAASYINIPLRVSETEQMERPSTGRASSPDSPDGFDTLPEVLGREVVQPQLGELGEDERVGRDMDLGG